MWLFHSIVTHSLVDVYLGCVYAMHIIYINYIILYMCITYICNICVCVHVFLHLTIKEHFFSIITIIIMQLNQLNKIFLRWDSTLSYALGPLSLVFSRMLLGQFSKNPPPSVSDLISHPCPLMSYHLGLPSARILLSWFSQNPLASY